MLDAYDSMILKRLYARRQITPNGCWESTLECEENHYPRVRYNNAKWAVHRLMLLFTRPEEFHANPEVMHLCDNKKCFNPEHLKGCTRTDNIRDLSAKGMARQQKEITHCKWGHPLTEDNVYRRKDGRKNCKTCMITRSRLVTKHQKETNDAIKERLLKESHLREHKS